MKKILLVSVCAVALALALGLAWLRYGSSAWLAERIGSYSLQYTGSKIEMQHGPVASIFPPGLKLDGISWESADKKCFFSANSLAIKPDLGALLAGRLSLKEIVLDGPDLKLDLRQARPAGAEDGEAGAKKPKTENTGNASFEIGRLILQRGKMSLLASSGQIRLDEINLSAEDLRNRQEARVTGDFVLALTQESEGRPEPEIAGNLAFRARARFYYPNLTLRQAAVTFTATNGAVLSWLSPLQLGLDGAINLATRELRANQANLSSAQGKLTFRGNANFADSQAQGQCTLALDMAKILGQRASANDQADALLLIDSPVRFDGSSLVLNEIAIKSSFSEGSGKLEFRLPENADPASLSGDLAFRRLALWSGRNESKKTQASVKKPAATESAPPFAHFPALDLRLQADDFQYASFHARKMLAEIQGAAGDYALKNGRMLWSAGSIEASATGNFAGNVFDVQAEGKNINAGLALRESGFKGFSGGLADFQATLNTHGLDLESLRATLSGRAGFSARNVKINLLEKIAEFLPSSIGAKAFPDAVQLFSAEMTASGGQWSIDPVRLEAKSLAATGQAKYSPAAGEIDGALNLKLGSVSLPLAFKGPVDDISWSMTGGFLRRLLRDLP